MLEIQSVLAIFMVISNLWVICVLGHGMMVDPPGRASRWRFNDSAPANYNDNELFCGGLTNTWKVHNGKCGLCGDDYGVPTPRPHELGGKYGEGHIVATYRSGSNIRISVQIIANHRGYFVFDICNVDVEPESDRCFKRLKLANGDERYYLKHFSPGTFHMDVHIPPNVGCKHCVLRWHYKAENMWGLCENGRGALGCGPQEIYRSCADISVKGGTRW